MFVMQPGLGSILGEEGHKCQKYLTARRMQYANSITNVYKNSLDGAAMCH